MPGPARKPAAIARIDGTYRADRHGKGILQGKPAGRPLGSAPKHLAPDAKAIWREVARLAPWLRQADRQAVEVYASLLLAFRVDPAGMGGRPLAILTSLAGRLGLVWGDRQRVLPDVTNAPPEDDPAEAYFSGPSIIQGGRR